MKCDPGSRWRFTILGAYKRRWAPCVQATSLVRDSSLWIEYGPRDCGSCREAQIAARYIRPFTKLRQRDMHAAKI
ncbi:hypothetical protein AJ87_16650 [Rhizobium yanglingense]|nr:hypothetical protein AJ87_16650 [Rhizobium yanglingense]